MATKADRLNPSSSAWEAVYRLDSGRLGRRSRFPQNAAKSWGHRGQNRLQLSSGHGSASRPWPRLSKGRASPEWAKGPPSDAAIREAKTIGEKATGLGESSRVVGLDAPKAVDGKQGTAARCLFK